MNFDRAAWEADAFGGHRFHNASKPLEHSPPPRPAELGEVELAQLLSEKMVISDAKALELFENQSEDTEYDEGHLRHLWYVRTLSPQAREQLKRTYKLTTSPPRAERFVTHLQGPGNTPAISTHPPPSFKQLGHPDPLNEWGILYKTRNQVLGTGPKYPYPIWECCWQHAEEPGCMFGYRDKSRNIPYTWFGGLRKFPRDQYDFVVRHARGIVFREDNLLACDDLHTSIVNVLTSVEVRDTFRARDLQRLHAPSMRKHLWQVADWMWQYNCHIRPDWPRDFPDDWASPDMFLYLRKHLPRQFYPLSNNVDIFRDLEKKLVQLENIISQVEKRSYIFGNPLPRLEKLQRRLKEYLDDTDTLIDDDLQVDLQEFQECLQEAELFISKTQISSKTVTDDIEKWYMDNVNGNKNIRPEDVEKFQQLVAYFSNVEKQFRENVDVYANLGKIENAPKGFFQSLYKKFWAYFSSSKTSPTSLDQVPTIKNNLATIEKTHTEMVKMVQTYLKDMVEHVNRGENIATVSDAIEMLAKYQDQLDELTELQTRLRSVYIDYKRINDMIVDFRQKNVSPTTKKPLKSEESKKVWDKLQPFMETFRRLETDETLEFKNIPPAPLVTVVSELLSDIRRIDVTFFYENEEIPMVSDALDTLEELEKVNITIDTFVEIAQNRKFLQQETRELATLIGGYYKGEWVRRFTVIEEYEMETRPLIQGVQYLVRDLKQLNKPERPTYFGYSFQMEFALECWIKLIEFFNAKDATLYNEVKTFFQDYAMVAENNIILGNLPGIGTDGMKSYLTKIQRLRKQFLQSFPDRNARTIDDVTFTKIIDKTLRTLRYILVANDATDVPTTDNRKDHQSLPLYIRKPIDMLLEKYGLFQQQIQVPAVELYFGQKTEKITVFDKYVTRLGVINSQTALTIEELRSSAWKNPNANRFWLIAGFNDTELFAYSKEISTRCLQYVFDAMVAILKGEQYEELTTKFEKNLVTLKSMFELEMMYIEPLTFTTEEKTALDKCEKELKKIYDEPFFTIWCDVLNTTKLQATYMSLVNVVKNLNTTLAQKTWLRKLALECGLLSSSGIWRLNVTYDNIDNSLYLPKTNLKPISTLYTPDEHIEHVDMTRAWVASLYHFCALVTRMNFKVTMLPYIVTVENNVLVRVLCPLNKRRKVLYRIGTNGPTFELFEMLEDSFQQWKIELPVLKIVVTGPKEFKIQKTSEQLPKSEEPLQVFVNILSLRPVNVFAYFTTSVEIVGALNQDAFPII